MHHPGVFRWLWTSLVVAGWLLWSGCSTTAMKGTPFYTGEYEKRTGPVENRVNLWPLAYYRDPALSVLWPIFEYSDDHTAVRPLYSVYERQRADGKRIHNVVWPLAQVDQVAGQYRIFPVFWSQKGTVVVFPLVWYLPEGDYGTASLFPLYWHHTSPRVTSTYVLWPIVHWETRPNSPAGAWWLFPIVGTTRESTTRRWWFLFPLGWVRTAPNERMSALFPIYYASHDADRDLFLSLPYLARHQPDGAGWRFVPLLWYDRTAAESRTVLTPLLYHHRDRAGTSHAVFPLYYTESSGRERAIYTVLGGFRRGGESASWICLPLLTGYRDTGQRQDLWYLAPLGHVTWTSAGMRSYLFPLYYYHAATGANVSLLWAAWGPPKQRRIAIPPLLGGLARDGDQRTLYAFLGLGQLGWGPQPEHRRQALLPLFYHDRDNFYTLPFGWHDEPNQHVRYVATPLIGSHEGKVNGWWLAPLVWHRTVPACKTTTTNVLWTCHQTRPGAVMSQAIPFYYYSRTGQFSATPNAYAERFLWLPPIFWHYRSQTPPKPAGQQLAIKQLSFDDPRLNDRTSTGCFPLWHDSRRQATNQPTGVRDFSLLFWLYDYRHTYGPDRDAATSHDYTRHRVLWRLYHYERSDDAVSLDLFPAIAYDRKPDGFRQTSFLWRFFRYATGPQGTKLDLLFIPLRR